MPVSEPLLTCCIQELRGRPGGLRHCALGRCPDLTSTPVSVSGELVCWRLASPRDRTVPVASSLFHAENLPLAAHVEELQSTRILCQQSPHFGSIK